MKVSCSDKDCCCGPCDSGYVDCSEPASFKHDPRSLFNLKQDVRNKEEAITAGPHSD